MEFENDKKKEEIKKVLSCFLCSAKVYDSLICPSCKILFCSKCLKNWFDKGETECPSCKFPISLDQMISLPFMNHLSDYFIKIDNKNNEKKLKKRRSINIQDKYGIIEEDDINDNSNLNKSHIILNNLNDFDKINTNNNNQLSHIQNNVEFCSNHKNHIIEYYCLSCNTKHCSKCLIITNEESKKHNGHQIISMKEKKRFNLDHLQKDLDRLPFIIKQLLKFKDNLEKDYKILEKKQEFMKNIINDISEIYYKRSSNKKFHLEINRKILEDHIKEINNLKNSYAESLKNFIAKNDHSGIKEFKQKIIKYNNIDQFQYMNNYDIYLNPNLNLYETDYLDININLYNETLGEIHFNVQGMDKQFHLKLNGETIEEILINLLIKLNEDGNENFYAFVLVKKKNDIVSIILDEKMIHNDTLILGKTLIRDKLTAFVDENNKLYIKVILVLIEC